MPTDSQKHASDEQIDLYSVGRLSGPEVANFEEHLLICTACREKLEWSDSWVRAVRRTGPQLQPEPERAWWIFRLPRLVPALAAAVLIFAAVTIHQISQRAGVAPVAVALETTRGESVASVPARQPLLLEPDLEGLPQLSAYRMEIVDQLGKRIWQTRVTSGQGSAGRVRAPGIAPGVYFVRLYNPGSGDLLREYGLEVRNPQ